MYSVKPPEATPPNLAKYIPNSSHLYSYKKSNHIPTKMQSLDSQVVNKFLTTINGEPEKKVGTTLDNSNIVWDPQTGEPIRPTQKPPLHPKTVKNVQSTAVQSKFVKTPEHAQVKHCNEFPKNAESNPPIQPKSPKIMETLDWKKKYDEAERKRKDLLAESQKAARDRLVLEKRIKTLEEEYRSLQSEHSEKAQQLSRLSKVSEKVYQDYDKLNNKYEVETKALHRALGAASKWYQENQKLRRESIARSSLDPNLLQLDEPDAGNDDELEELRKTVKDLSQQVATFQSEINRLRHNEFEANEQLCNLNGLLDEERQKNLRQENELKELRLLREKFASVSVMVHGEVEALRMERDRAAQEASKFQAQAQAAQKERNVLAHQSSLLMGDITTEDRFFKVLLEVEDLKRKLEEEEQKHTMELQALQERLDARSTDDHVEILEEKLKLAENELQLAIERAEQLQNKINQQIPRPPAPPPPPPPPPPPIPNTSLPKKIPPKPQQIDGDSLEDMAQLLGIQRNPKPSVVQGGAIDDLINEIKGGKFTLKATEKQKCKQEEPPAAVQEMLSIIGTLKRTTHRRPTANKLVI